MLKTIYYTGREVNNIHVKCSTAHRQHNIAIVYHKNIMKDYILPR